MPRTRSQSESSSSEWEVENGVEREVPIADNLDWLFGNYLDLLKVIDQFPEESEETREAYRCQAKENLFSAVGKLDNVDEALEKVNDLLAEMQRKRSTDLNPQTLEEMQRLKLEQQLQLEGSSVELIEERIQVLDDTATETSTEGNEDPQPNPGDDNEPNIEPEMNLVQLFDITEDGETIFKKEVLDDLCDQIGDRPVSIISTAGKFRQGKTFWNNVLLKGLQQEKADFKPTDYIGGHDGIRFQSGYIRHTKGIMVWPKVFIRKDKEGKELAVILMDTQGKFDTTSDMIDSAIIFSISLLMSSIKIFNVRKQIDAQDLDSLNLFLAFSQRTDERAGQHFIIMIRDALESGFQPSYIESLQAQTRRAPELKKLLEGIYSAFEKVECFMAKTPSEHVLSASGEIKAQDCGDRFLRDLCECANHVLENLVPKKFMGNHLTGNTLKEYVKNLVNHITENNHKAIGSAFQATSELFFEKAKAAAAEYFAAAHDQLMRESGHQPINPKVYEKTLKKFVDEALQEYSSKPLFGTQEAKERTFLALKESLEAKCQEKLLSNRSRFRDFLMTDAVHQSSQLYEKEMKPDFWDSLLGKATVEQVKDRHERAFPEAMLLFEDAVEPFNDEVDLIESKRNLLTKMILTRFEGLQSDNLVVQVNSMINTLADNYGKHLKEQIPLVKKLDEIGMFLEREMNTLNTNFEANKAQFIIDISQLMPKIDLNMLRPMIDNFKDTKRPLFQRCEDYFESEVRAQLNMERLRNKMIDMRHRQNEAQKRLQAQQGRIQEQLTDTQQQLDEEKRKREAAEKSNYLNMIVMLSKQLNEQTQQQLENAREERQRKEMREAQEEANRLEKEGNEARIRLEMTKEASTSFAVNKAFDIFQSALKGTTNDNIEAAEKAGRNSSEKKLKELLKEANVGEARELLEPKIQALLAEKQREFEIRQEEKAFLERVEAFSRKWRAEIMKIHDLDKAQLLKRNSSIRREGVLSSISDATIKILEDMLESRITMLQGAHIEKLVSELKVEFSQQLRETKFDSLPTLEDGHAKVKLMIEKLRKTLDSQELPEKEWGFIEEKCQIELMKIYTQSLDFIEKDLALRREMKRMREMNTKVVLDDAIESFEATVKLAKAEIGEDKVEQSTSVNEERILMEELASPTTEEPSILPEKQKLTKFEAKGKSSRP